MTKLMNGRWPEYRENELNFVGITRLSWAWHSLTFVKLLNLVPLFFFFSGNDSIQLSFNVLILRFLHQFSGQLFHICGAFWLKYKQIGKLIASWLNIKKNNLTFEIDTKINVGSYSICEVLPMFLTLLSLKWRIHF